MLIALTAACSVIGRNSGNGNAGNTVVAFPFGALGGAGEARRTPAAVRREGTLFVGTIGDAKVELDIKRDGESLTGTYFYRRSGSANRLNLKGQIRADGSFTMRETDAGGKHTGSFKGTWKEDPNEAGAMLEGEWLKPGQTEDGQGFYAWEQMVYFTNVEMTTREVKETIKAKRATLTAEYPELTGSPNAAGFNQLVKKEAMDTLAGFRKSVAGLTPADIRRMTEVGNYIDVGYNIEYADDTLVSVNFGVGEFTGGAHPNYGTYTITYDLKAGKRLQLGDLFKPGSKYLNTIAELATADLQARTDPESGENRGLAQDIFEDGAKPIADNYENWNITRKGLMFTFPPYQVGSYADGPQTVIIPLTKLKDIALPNGPLSKAAK